MTKSHEFTMDSYLGEIFGFGIEFAAEALSKVIHGFHEVTGVSAGGSSGGGHGGHH